MSNSTSGIEIELDHFHHQPFQELKGKVRVTTTTPPKSMELRVFWFTRGRGDEEVLIVHSIKLDPTQQLSDFSWTLPAAPYSFAGQLITLAWAVEVVDNKERSLDLVPFLLSPNGEELQLAKVADNSSKGKPLQRFSQKARR